MEAATTITSGDEQAATTSSGEPTEPPAPVKPKLMLPSMMKKEVPKAGRNDPCPCGSGKKFKSCCGRMG
jgi:preprotein translocase subunit SecA